MDLKHTDLHRPSTSMVLEQRAVVIGCRACRGRHVDSVNISVIYVCVDDDSVALRLLVCWSFLLARIESWVTENEQTGGKQWAAKREEEVFTLVLRKAVIECLHLHKDDVNM